MQIIDGQAEQTETQADKLRQKKKKFCCVLLSNWHSRKMNYRH